MRFLALLVAGLALSACAGGVADLETAGRTSVTVETHEPAELAAANAPEKAWACGVPIKKTTYVSGKEVGSLTFKRKADCTIEVSATEIKAFDAIEFAARVAAVQANEQGETLRQVLRPEALREITAIARLFVGGG